MSTEADADRELLGRICAGEQRALGELLDTHRERLRRMVQLRLDRRLQGRIDPSDVIHEAFLDASRRLAEFAADPKMPPFVWLRLLTAQRLVTLHRVHLGVKARDAAREVSLHSGPLPSADSRSLAAQLLGRLTSPSRAADSGRDPDQDPGCAQLHGSDRPRDPGPAPLRGARQRRDGRRPGTCTRLPLATATSGRCAASRRFSAPCSDAVTRSESSRAISERDGEGTNRDDPIHSRPESHRAARRRVRRSAAPGRASIAHRIRRALPRAWPTTFATCFPRWPWSSILSRRGE